MLIDTSIEFNNKVLHSKDYLNCPKFILNEILDSIYRQFHADIETAKNVISDYLKKQKIDKPKDKADKFVNWRKDVKMKDFTNLNINPFIDAMPTHVLKQHETVNNWYKTHTTEHWRYGYLVSTKIIDYPYKSLY